MQKVALLLLLILSEKAYSQASDHPCPRNQPVTAYDNETNKVFLFGGYCSALKKRLNDLWEFDGKHWKLVETELAPEPRSGHAMIYDAFRKRLVVFGGNNDQGELLNDLWSWNGVDWVLLSEDGPSPRQSHRMVFNTDNGDIFLFGGSDAQKQSLNDTWVFRDSEWIALNTKDTPPARLQHTLAYDQQRKKVVLFGGFDRTENGKVIYGDTWEWSTQQGWTLKHKDEKMARDHHAMTYDPTSNTTLLFGGYNGGYLGDTWFWNGEQWTPKGTNGPARAGKPALMYDPLTQNVILFGGGNSENMRLMDFWQFDRVSNAWAPFVKK